MSETLSQCLQESYESVKEIIGRYRHCRNLAKSLEEVFEKTCLLFKMLHDSLRRNK